MVSLIQSLDSLRIRADLLDGLQLGEAEHRAHRVVIEHAVVSASLDVCREEVEHHVRHFDDHVAEGVYDLVAALLCGASH